MRKDYKGIAENDVLAQLCIYCVRKSYDIDDEYTPILFLGWGKYTNSMQMLGLRLLKNAVSQTDLVQNKASFLTNLTTDSTIDIKLYKKWVEEGALKDRILDLKSLKGEDINYNAIITLATNHAYYLGQKTKETAEILNRNLSFVLLLEIDFVELEKYKKEILVNSKLTNDQTLYIQKGLDLLRSLYFSEIFIKYRKEDEEAKLYFKDIYRKILEEMENDFQNKNH